MYKMNVPKYQPSQYKTKFDAVADMLKGGETVKQIKNRMLVSDSYIYLAKKKLREAAGEVVETVRQTAAEHNNKVKEMIEDWRVEAEADTDVDAILDERAATYGSFEDVAGCAQEIKNAIRICNNSELDDDQIEALDMIASKIARVVNGNPNHIDSWIDIAGYATLVADRLQGKTR
jgi:transposase-like protein